MSISKNIIVWTKKRHVNDSVGTKFLWESNKKPRELNLRRDPRAEGENIPIIAMSTVTP